MDPSLTASRIRAELRDCIRSIDVTTRADGLRTFTGTAFAGASLVGPPERVHGGFHAAIRLLAPLARVLGEDPLAGGPLALDLVLRRPLALESSIPFEGELAVTPDGFALTTRFDGTDRLKATARRLAPGEERIDLEAWRSALAEDLAVPQEYAFEARGTVPTRVGPRFVSMRLDAPFWAKETNELIRYLPPDGALDATFACVALDLVGACTVGYAIRAHAFTTHMSIVLVDCPPHDTPAWLLGSRRTVPVPDSTLPGLDVRGTRIPETRVDVLLGSDGLERAHAYGSIAIYPARPVP